MEMTGKSGHFKLHNWSVKKIAYQNLRSSILFVKFTDRFRWSMSFIKLHVTIVTLCLMFMFC